MYIVNNGMLEAADLNPQLAAATTLDKTNPRIAEQKKDSAATTMEVATGKIIKRTSPLVFFAAAAGGLMLLGFLQRKAA